MATPILDLKSSFLKDYTYKLNELRKRQSSYRRVLVSRMKNFRRNQIMETNLKQGITKLQKERADIKSSVWTAVGASSKKSNAKNLTTIKCHISCEEKLAEDIQFLKAGITNIKRELGHITRQIYDLNRRTVPATRAVENAVKTRKRLMMQENQLEVGIHQECLMTAENKRLREELLEHLTTRKSFNDLYVKLIHELNSGKKYMTDLIGYAMHQFDSSIELYEKFDFLKKRDVREIEQKKMEMRDLSRYKAAMNNEMECSKKKHINRPAAPLQPKEYRRRQNMRENLKKKLNVNKDVLHKIFQYTGQSHIKTVIEKFKQQENLYYSYFNYANETSYRMTLLNNAVNRLYSDIDDLKLENRNTMQIQLDEIQKMEEQLDEKLKRNEELKTLSQNTDERLIKLFQGLKLIRDHSKTNWSSLQELLGDYNEVDLQNLRVQMQLVEKRVYSILTAVYQIERRNTKIKANDYLVKHIEKFCDYVTELDDVVLAQQCPECAEVDALNIDETESAAILPMVNVKKKLYDRVTQPEMQYRLHSMSSCRFPRARMLTARRNLEIYGNS